MEANAALDNSSASNFTVTNGTVWDNGNMDAYTGMDSMIPEAAQIIKDIVLPVICACGILGIILTVIVLSRKNMTTSTNCFLMALAIADLLFLLLLASTLVNNFFEPHSKQHYEYQIYANFSIIFMQMFLLASIWLTVMLAVERFIAICRPFLAVKLLTIRNARILIACIFVIAVAVRLPNFWENRIVTHYDTSTNKTWSFLEPTEFSFNEHYTVLYPWLVDGLLASMAPFLLLLLLNARLIWEVRKSTQYMQCQLNMPRGSVSNNVIHKEELQVTVMLISVIMVFFICQAPYVIYTAIQSITRFGSTSSGFMLFRYITMMLLVLKSAINFILYCWFSEKFWMTLKRLFGLERCLHLSRCHRGADDQDYLKMKRFSSCTRDTITI